MYNYEKEQLEVLESSGTLRYMRRQTETVWILEEFFFFASGTQKQQNIIWVFFFFFPDGCIWKSYNLH